VSTNIAREGEDGRAEWLPPMPVPQLAKLFGVHRNTMARRLRDGSVKARKFGSLWRLHVSEWPAESPPARH